MMVLVAIQDGPPRLRGRLSTLLLELQAGVYAGSLTSKGREAVWELIVDHLEEGSAVMAWPDPDNATGVDFWTQGANRRQAVVIDGVRLVDFPRLKESIADEHGAVDSVEVKLTLRNKDLKEVSSPRQRG